MKLSTSIISAAVLSATILGGALVPSSDANAAAAAKPAGCHLKSGGTSTNGTVIGTWKYEGKLWHKIAAPTRKPFFLDLLPVAAKSK